MSARANGAAVSGGTVEGAAKVHILRGLNFKLLSHTKGKSGNVFFLLLIISVRSGHNEFSPQGLKSLATLLCECMYVCMYMD